MAMEPHVGTAKHVKRLTVLDERSVGAVSEADVDVDVDVNVDVDAELRAYEEAERDRLGLRRERKQWVDGMLKPKMTKSERQNVTLLISGLTAAQDFLVEGALRGVGYNVKYFGMSNNAGLQTGKEFG